MRLSRRAFVCGAIASPAFAAQTVYPGAGVVRPALMNAALAALFVHSGRVVSRDFIGIVDFSLPSAIPRFHIVDVLAGRTTTLLVAHGNGSDPEHTGMVQRTSNIEGSLMSSEGAYLMGPEYDGRNGRSRRLIGLDPSNDQAERRAIVLHGAWYATAEVAAAQGKLGRSDGCFAVAHAAMPALLATLRDGRLLYAGR